MKDFYFIAGLGIGAMVGMIVMYKSKSAQEIAHKCEDGITEATNEIKKKMQPKKTKKSSQNQAK